MTETESNHGSRRRLEYPRLGGLRMEGSAQASMGSDGGLSGRDFCEMYGTRSQAISTLARINQKPEGKRSGLWCHNVQQSFARFDRSVETCKRLRVVNWRIFGLIMAMSF